MSILRPWYREEEGGGDAGGTGGTGGTGDMTPAGDVGNGDMTPAGDEAGTGTNYFQNVPEDWRTQIAGEDESRLNDLKRYSDFNSFVASGFEAKDRIRKGEISTGLPDDPTPEQLSTWREANGVPQEAYGYDIQLEQGFVMGEEDERILAEVMPAFHSANIPSSAVNAVVNSFMLARQHEAERIGRQDVEDQTNAIRDLKTLWGGEYTSNFNRVQGVLARMPEEIRGAVESARSDNGAGPLIFNLPGLLQFFESEERDRNPAGTVVPNAINPVQAIDDGIAEIEKIMSDDPDTYWKDQKMQDRYDELLQVRERMREQG